MQRERWCAGWERDDFNILPCNSRSESSAERFHRGFLCGESCGEMQSAAFAICAVRLLCGREDSLQESLFVLREQVVDARDFDDVDADADDRHGKAYCSWVRGVTRLLSRRCYADA